MHLESIESPAQNQEVQNIRNMIRKRNIKEVDRNQEVEIGGEIIGEKSLIKKEMIRGIKKRRNLEETHPLKIMIRNHLKMIPLNIGIE